MVEKEIKNVSGITYFESFPVIASTLSFSKLNILKEPLTKTNLATSIWKPQTTSKTATIATSRTATRTQSTTTAATTSTTLTTIKTPTPLPKQTTINNTRN